MARAGRRADDGRVRVVLAVITIAVFGALALLAGNITGALTRVAAYIT